MPTDFEQNILANDLAEEPEQDFSSVGAVDSYLSQNIIGHDWAWNSKEKLGYKEEEYSLEDATNLLDTYDLSNADRSELISDSRSIQHMYDAAEDKKRNNTQLGLIQSHGALGMVGSMGISILDAPSWVIGAGAGKVAGIGINAYKIGNTGRRLAQAGAGAATAVASVGLLEASLGNELSAEQIAINGALGFTLGYTFAGSNSRSPEGIPKIQQMADGTTQVEMSNAKESFMLPFLHSPADNMKTSTNPAAVEAGYKITRSSGDVGLQDGDTVNDSLRRTKGYLTTAKEDWEGFAKEFEELNGRKLTPDDERAINKIGNKIDHEYNIAKDSEIVKLKEFEVNKQTTKLLEESKAKGAESIELSKSAIRDIEALEFTPKIVPEPIRIQNRLTQKFRESPESKKIRDKVRNDNRNAKAKHERLVARKIKAENKRLQSELDAQAKELKKNTKAIEKNGFSDEALSEFELRARETSKSRLDEMMRNVDSKYAKAVNLVREFKYKYATELKKYDVDGLKNADDSFHWSRQYDADKIAQNTTGAVDSFHRALMANFPKMTNELSAELRMQANRIVDNILASKSSMETIDLDKSVISRELASEAGKTNVIGKNLKDRKLRLDGSELVDFMSNDVVGNMTGYSRSVGGRIGVKEALGIDKNFGAEEFANINSITGKDKKLFDKALQQAYGTFGIDPHANSITSKLVRAFTGLNYINFGGWFGANTLSDLSNIAYDFGLGNTTKYLTKDIVGAIKGDKNGGKLARYLGYASESLTNDRALMYGADEFAPTTTFAGERAINKGGALMSKASGMNMVVDLMDRVTSMSSLDYMLTAPMSTKFVKTMNRLGMSMESIKELRANNKLVKWDGDSIAEVNFDSLSVKSKANLERGLRRAISDVVLKGGGLDSPEFLTQILGSHSLAKALFQFMRFPVIAYNKIGRKMLHNFDAIDGLVATATGGMILGLTTQMKDIGKDKPRFDLDSKDGQINSIKYIVERMPHFAFVGLIQSQADVLGRVAASATGQEYKSYGAGMNMGVTMDRISDISEAGGRFMSGDSNSRDVRTLKSFLSTNLAWLQPLNNMVDDKIKEEF